MSTIKISELATEGISLSDFFAKADANGLASKNTIENLLTLVETVGEVGFKGSLSISQAASVSVDGWYLANESGDYIVGGVTTAVNISNNVAILIISDAATTAVLDLVNIPVSLTLDSTPTPASTNAVESGGVADAISAESTKTGVIVDNITNFSDLRTKEGTSLSIVNAGILRNDGTINSGNGSYKTSDFITASEGFPKYITLNFGNGTGLGTSNTVAYFDASDNFIFGLLLNGQKTIAVKSPYKVKVSTRNELVSTATTSNDLEAINDESIKIAKCLSTFTDKIPLNGSAISLPNTGIMREDGTINSGAGSYKVSDFITTTEATDKFIQVDFGNPTGLTTSRNLAYFDENDVLIFGLLMNGVRTIGVPYPYKVKIATRTELVASAISSTSLKDYAIKADVEASLLTKVVSKTGVNLLDPTTVLDGKGYTPAGSLLSNVAWEGVRGVTDRIYFNGNSQLTVNNYAPGEGFSNLIFDIDDNLIDDQDTATITNVAGGVYAKFTVGLATTPQIQYGAISKPFEVYSPIAGYLLEPTDNEVDVNRTTSRTVIQETINSLESGASKDNIYNIKAGGIFEVLNQSQFDVNYNAELDYYQLIDLKDYINIEGESVNKTFAIAKLDPNLGASFPYEKYQGIYIDANANFSNFNVQFQTGRYALHIDGGFIGRLKDTTQIVSDCYFWHQGNTGDAFNRWGIGTAFGHGSNSGQITKLLRCTFRNPNNGLFFHNNYDFEKQSITIYEDCDVISDLGNNDGNVIVQNLGSGVDDVLEIRNTRITQAPFKLTYDNLSLTNLIADNNDIEIVTDLEARAVRNYDCVDMCLRIDSLSTGGGSYVLLTQSSSAYDSLFGDSTQFVEIQKNNEIYRYGYSRRTGNQGLNGYAYGDWNIKENLTQSVYVNSLGKRLGDCSTVNKVLTLNIDGTSYDVTFNKNYDGQPANTLPNYDNATILAEINAVIGSVALASEFKVAKEYYPNFDGLETRTYEDSSEALVGYGVVFTEDNKIRKALNSDGKIDGILLDSVATGETARIITKGRINRMQSNDSLRFQINEVWASPLPKPVGNELGISTTTAGLFDPTASPKLVRCYEQDVYKILR